MTHNVREYGNRHLGNEPTSTHIPYNEAEGKLSLNTSGKHGANSGGPDAQDTIEL